MANKVTHGKVLSVDRQYVPTSLYAVEGEVPTRLIISVLIEKDDGKRIRFYNRVPHQHNKFSGDWETVVNGDYVEITEKGDYFSDYYLIVLNIKKGE